MATDRQLSKNFWLHEAPGWERATEAEAAKLQETTARVLQPLRNMYGPVHITSWMWWSSGARRTGSHAQGGTVDAVVSGGKTREAWEWGNTHLMPSGYIGRWIYEPETPNQGEHLHIAPRADMVAAFGDPSIQSLQELPNGDMFVFRDWTATGGTYANPYELPGITARAGFNPPVWLTLGILGLLYWLDMSMRATQGAGRWQLKGA